MVLKAFVDFWAWRIFRFRVWCGDGLAQEPPSGYLPILVSKIVWERIVEDRILNSWGSTSRATLRYQRTMTVFEYCPTGFLNSPSDTFGAILWLSTNRKTEQAQMLDGERLFTNHLLATPSRASWTLSVKRIGRKRKKSDATRMHVCNSCCHGIYLCCA